MKVRGGLGVPQGGIEQITVILVVFQLSMEMLPVVLLVLQQKVHHRNFSVD